MTPLWKCLLSTEFFILMGEYSIGLYTGVSSWAILSVRAFWYFSMRKAQGLYRPTHEHSGFPILLSDGRTAKTVSRCYWRRELIRLYQCYLLNASILYHDLEDSTIFTLLHLLQWNNRFFTNCLLTFPLVFACVQPVLSRGITGPFISMPRRVFRGWIFCVITDKLHAAH